MKISDKEFELKIIRIRFDKAIELLEEVRDGEIDRSWIDTAIRVLNKFRP